LLTANQVYAEATIAFPLIVAASFAKANQAEKEEQQPDAQTTA
jgi:deoxyhypusine synthase